MDLPSISNLPPISNQFNIPVQIQNDNVILLMSSNVFIKNNNIILFFETYGSTYGEYVSTKLAAWLTHDQFTRLINMADNYVDIENYLDDLEMPIDYVNHIIN
jgi:hypothetical protein